MRGIRRHSTIFYTLIVYPLLRVGWYQVWRMVHSLHQHIIIILPLVRPFFEDQYLQYRPYHNNSEIGLMLSSLSWARAKPHLAMLRFLVSDPEMTFRSATRSSRRSAQWLVPRAQVSHKLESAFWKVRHCCPGWALSFKSSKPSWLSRELYFMSAQVLYCTPTTRL